MEQRRKAMLEMPKLIKAWKIVSCSLPRLEIPDTNVSGSSANGLYQVGKRNWTKWPK